MGRGRKREKEKKREGRSKGRREGEGESEASERGSTRLGSSDRRREGVHSSPLAYLMRPGCFFQLVLIQWLIGRKYRTRPGLIRCQVMKTKRNTTRSCLVKNTEEIKKTARATRPDPFSTPADETSSVPAPPRSIPTTVACSLPVILAPSPTLMLPETGWGTGDRAQSTFLAPVWGRRIPALVVGAVHATTPPLSSSDPSQVRVAGVPQADMYTRISEVSNYDTVSAHHIAAYALVNADGTEPNQNRSIRYEIDPPVRFSSTNLEW